MVLSRDKPVNVGVTTRPFPTLASANVPTVAEPDSVAESLPSKPEAITAVPVRTAVVFLLYTLLEADRPSIIIGAAAILAFSAVVTPDK